MSANFCFVCVEILHENSHKHLCEHALISPSDFVHYYNFEGNYLLFLDTNRMMCYTYAKRTFSKLGEDI